MKNKILLLLRYINRFSFFEGIRLFVLLHSLKRQQINFKGYPNIYLRKNTSDFDVFNQVFIDLEYNMDDKIKPKFIIDAGANIGLTSLFFINKYPNTKIVSIEPDHENFQLLCKNCSKYHLIFPINKALWSNNKPVYFTNVGAKDSHHISDKNISSELVETITIPDIMNYYKVDKIDILKLDIEGAEKELFSNNVDSWLPRVEYLIIEIHDRFLPGCSMSVFNALSNYDFSMEIKGELLIFKVNSIVIPKKKSL